MEDFALVRRLVWRRLDRPGHEAVQLSKNGNLWEFTGSVVMIEGGVPCRLDYRIACGPDWVTHSAQITGWVGEDQEVDCHIRVDPEEGRWWLNEVEQPQVAGCIDLDLNFSPVTNTLPIRRLELSPGESGAVPSAWLRFPSFTLERLDQVYRRSGEWVYRYESGGGSFRADLSVDSNGLVRHYPGVWKMEE
jgi:uncharacterized protein